MQVKSDSIKAGNFSGSHIGRGLAIEFVFLLVALVQFPSEGVHLSSLEACDPEGAPPFGGPNYGAENELEHQLLAEGIGDVLQPLALFDEQPLQQARGATAWR